MTSTAPTETTTSLIAEEIRTKVATIHRLLDKKGFAGIAVELGGQIGCGKTSLLQVLERVTGIKHAEETVMKNRMTSQYMQQYYEDEAPLDRGIMVEVGHTLANTMEFYKHMSLIDQDLAPRLLFMDRGLHSVWTFTEMICDARRLEWMNKAVDEMRGDDKDAISHYNSPPPRGDLIDTMDDLDSALFRSQLQQMVDQQSAYLRERNYFALPIFLHLDEEHCAARRAVRAKHSSNRLRIAEHKLLSKESNGKNFNAALKKHALKFYADVLNINPTSKPAYVLSDLLELVVKKLLKVPQPTQLPAAAIKKRKMTQTSEEEIEAALSKAEWKMDEAMTRASYTNPEPPAHNVPLRPEEHKAVFKLVVTNHSGEERTESFTTKEAREEYKTKTNCRRYYQYEVSSQGEDRDPADPPAPMVEVQLSSAYD